MSDKSSEPEYTFEQTQQWAEQEPKEFDDGITFLYVLGAFAFLIIFAALLLYFATGESTPKSNVKIEDLNVETDATSTEVQTEYDLIADAKKDKNTIKAAK